MGLMSKILVVLTMPVGAAMVAIAYIYLDDSFQKFRPLGELSRPLVIGIGVCGIALVVSCLSVSVYIQIKNALRRTNRET